MLYPKGLSRTVTDTGLEIHHSEINTFHNVCKSKISFTELYEFIRHIHECQFNLVYLYFNSLFLEKKNMHFITSKILYAKTNHNENS